MYTEPALTPGIYQEIISRRPLEAIVYRETSETSRIQVDRVANSLLNKLRDHPYVAIHGDRWEKRFSIKERESVLEAIQKIYVSLRNDRKEFHYPTLAFKSFEKLYQEDLRRREDNFRSHVYHAIAPMRGLSELKQSLISPHREVTPPALLIHRLTLSLREASCEEILWKASAASDYWEAIPHLFARQVSWEAKNGYAYPAIEQTEKNRDWIAAFNIRSPIPIPPDETAPMSFHEVICQSRRAVRSRVSFFCEQLSQQSWFGREGAGAALWHVEEYAKEKIDEHYLAKKLAECAAEYGWGKQLWRLTAATDYWEAIPLLLAADLSLPMPDDEEPRTILRIAEQSKSDDWKEAFLYHTR